MTAVSLSVILVLAWTKPVHAYYVSGVVEFDYRDYETKTGDAKTSERIFTQTYRTNITSYLVDPRIIQFNAGVDYLLNTELTHNTQDNHELEYDLNASFFPGMKYSANGYARQNVQTFESANNISGYSSRITAYGGSIGLDFSRTGTKRRNNNSNNDNNDNNGNANRSGFLRDIPLPTISVSRDHVESQSLSILSPHRETRDNTMAALHYRPATTLNLDMSGGLEQYKDLVLHSAYETKTANLTSLYSINPDADLRIDGNLSDRNFKNFDVTSSSDRTWSYSANLNFKEKNRLSHFYTYNASHQSSFATESDLQAVAGGMNYKINDEWNVLGGLNYGKANYVQKNAGQQPDIKVTQESASAQGGVLYAKVYTPSFLGPFALQTNYGLNYGYNKYDTSTVGQPKGSGFYYVNNAGLALNSKGWQQENLSLTANYSNKRDQSPLHNDIEQESLGVNYISHRLARTVAHAQVMYHEQTNKSDMTTIVLSNQPTYQQSRSLMYDLGADYTATEFFMVLTGASRGKTNATSYTLATQTPATSTIASIDDVVYAAANFTYPITRLLQYRATVRDEYHRTESVSTLHKETYIVDMFLDYRIRQVFINLEAKWQEDTPSNALRSQQQYYFVKLTRPF